MAQETSHREVILELLVNVVAPTVVLTGLSDEARLGNELALLLALCFPLGHALYTALSIGRVSPIAALSMTSVLLTGGIGLLELSVRWFAWKEAAFPLAMGLAVILSVRTRWPAIPTLLDPLLDHDKVDALLRERRTLDSHEVHLRRCTSQLGLIFLVTAGATFAFARYMVVSQTGTEAFNTELGLYTAWSFPVLGVPSTLWMVWVLRGVLIGIEDRTGVEIEELLR